MAKKNEEVEVAESANKIHTEEYANDLGAHKAKMTGGEKDVKKKNFMPTELITPEMREAGVTEETELKTREEMVAELGEDMVKTIEDAGAKFAKAPKTK